MKEHGHLIGFKAIYSTIHWILHLTSLKKDFRCNDLLTYKTIQQ